MGGKGVAAWAVVLSAGLYAAAGAPVDPEALRPGLVATYRDAARPTPAEVVRLEPVIALALKAGEAPHPRLGADGGTARWEGHLNVVRAGSYRFRVRLRGRFRLTLAGRDVLTAEAKEATAVLKEGLEVRLEAGPQPLAAEFTRLPGAARVEVLWQAAGFREEPLPYEPLGHLPKQAPARLADDGDADHGRFLFEEHNCLACHGPRGPARFAAGLAGRRGPDLSLIGGRARAGWVYHWLEAPDKVRPGAVMPRLFADDEGGRVERYAVSRYLASLGGPVTRDPVNPEEARRRAAHGRVLFHSVGCTACHGETSLPLTGLGGKTTPRRLAAYLADPLATDPSGRMPNMLLRGDEAADLAHYLCQDRSGEPDLPAAPGEEQVLAAFRRVDEQHPGEDEAFRKLPADARLVDLGRRVVIAKGCANCHTIAPHGHPLPGRPAPAALDDIGRPEARQSGCLADGPGRRGPAPQVALTAAERRSVRRFLGEGTRGPGSPAPAFAARAALQRFRCLACHSRDGEGGLRPEMVEGLRKYEKAENAEAVVPPPLTGVAYKLRTPWLRQVLTQGGRARPWMALRMPHFGGENLARLAEGLAALEGTEADDRPHAVPLTAAKLDAGRFLIGKGAFGCISCHDLAGIPNHGTRGPDLASMTQRVRYDWYRRWLEQPQRLQPGTRMPSAFSGGTSLLAKVLDGSADAQAEAMWAYLSLGPGLPLPEGLELPKGLTLAVKNQPVVLRTFMPDAGSRAVAVGYPGGVSAAFDAARCRLAYGWSGNFLDASPVWNDRGGNPAKVLGVRFWTASAGCPWGASSSQEPPDFGARARDPAYGAPLPEGKVYDGPRQLVFEGYGVDKSGWPTFRYRVHAADPRPVAVTERPGALHCGAGVGLARDFTVTAPAHQTAWLLAGETSGEPRLLDAKGSPQALDLKAGLAEVQAAGRLLLPQDGGRAVVLVLSAAPEGTSWQLRRVGGKWQALLRVPAGAGAEAVRVRLHVWVPYRDDPALLKDLAAAP
jgi:mono/diheme cytochrome c family protein